MWVQDRILRSWRLDGGRDGEVVAVGVCGGEAGEGKVCSGSYVIRRLHMGMAVRVEHVGR